MNEDKKILFNYGFIAFAAGLVVGMLVGFGIGRASLHDNGGGADTVAGGINAAKGFTAEAQRQSEYVSSGIREAQTTADRLADVQRDTSKTVGELTESVDRCQRILDAVSTRAEKNTEATKKAEGSL